PPSAQRGATLGRGVEAGSAAVELGDNTIAGSILPNDAFVPLVRRLLPCLLGQGPRPGGRRWQTLELSAVLGAYLEAAEGRQVHGDRCGPSYGRAIGAATRHQR